VVALLGSYGAKSSTSRARFGLSKMLDPNFRPEAKLFFHSNIQNLTEASSGLFEYIFFGPKASPLDIVGP
jgi:hypothetical protein